MVSIEFIPKYDHTDLFSSAMHDLIICTTVDFPVSRFCWMRLKKIRSGISLDSLIHMIENTRHVRITGLLEGCQMNEIEKFYGLTTTTSSDLPSSIGTKATLAKADILI